MADDLSSQGIAGCPAGVHEPFRAVNDNKHPPG